MVSTIKSVILLLLVSMVSQACETDPMLFDIQNLNDDEIGILGHGGMGNQFKYPTNTYESVEPCLRIGADGVEIDIQISSDGVPVVFHNDEMDAFTSCSGTINDQTWAQIDGCKMASPFSSQIYIVSLEGLLSSLDQVESHIFTLDCKLVTNSADYSGFTDQFASSIDEVLSDFNLGKNVFIQSPDAEFLEKVRLLNSSYKLFIKSSSMSEGIEACDEHGFYGIVLQNDDVSAANVQSAHDKGYYVMIYNLYSEDDNVDAMLKNTDFVQTDKAIHFLKVFHKYKTS